MEKKRVLYVSQEINPYTGETSMGDVANLLPQKTQENGKDIRIFLPRFGTINERRHRIWKNNHSQGSRKTFTLSKDLKSTTRWR